MSPIIQGLNKIKIPKGQKIILNLLYEDLEQTLWRYHKLQNPFPQIRKNI